ESELQMLEERTNEQIRRITRVVQRLGERYHHFRSRKKDYLYLAKWFANMTDVYEAHELAAVVFGVSHTRHLFSDHIPTDDIYTSIWEEAPMEHETNPRIRNYREKTRAGAIINQQALKEEAKRVHLDQLPVIEPHVRKILLSWIGRAMMRKDKTIQTEHGRVVKVHLIRDERMVLQAEDGSLEMPKVIFEFLEKVAKT